MSTSQATMGSWATVAWRCRQGRGEYHWSTSMGGRRGQRTRQRGRDGAAAGRKVSGDELR